MCKNQLVKKSNNFECEIWTLWTIFLVFWTLYAGVWLFLSYQRTFYSYPIWLPADTMDFYTTKNLLINQSIWFFQENVGVDVTLLTRNKNRSYGEHKHTKNKCSKDSSTWKDTRRVTYSSRLFVSIPGLQAKGWIWGPTCTASSNNSAPIDS